MMHGDPRHGEPTRSPSFAPPIRTRVRELVPIRYSRMLVSPFTFYSGLAAVMVADLAATRAIGVHVQATQRHPDFNTCMMPLITRRSSIRGLPRVPVERYGMSRANCRSFSQNCSRSIHSFPSETLVQKIVHAGILFIGSRA